MASPRLVVFALTSAVFFVIVLYQRSYPSKPARVVALGISLHVNHGAVSIRQDDGSFHDIGEAGGDVMYLELMKHLSQRSSQHPSPPYTDGDDQWNDQPRQFLRNIRKTVGLPASSDVAILASMVQKLVKLAGPSTSVIISYPAIPGLTQEDVADVETYLGLPVFEGNHWYQPHTVAAAYVGYGMGLCKSFNNRKKCTEEGLNLPVRQTLLVEYSETALLLHCQIMREAYDFGESVTYESSNLDLTETNPSDPDVLANIRDFVTEFARDQIRYPGIHVPKACTVILTGPAKLVNEVAFQATIKDGIRILGLEVELLDKRPEYIASRGAAELAWRSFMLAQQAEL